jgi:hypothetical protein
MPWGGGGITSTARIQRIAAGRQPISGEHTDDERVRMRGAWSHEAGPSLAPLLSRGCRRVQRGNDVASLPAPIRWRVRSSEQASSVRYVSDPRALDGARTNGQLLHGQETPGYSISAISLATLRYSPRAISSIGFSSSNARIGRCSQTGIDSGRRTRASRLIISASSISRSARAPVARCGPRANLVRCSASLRSRPRSSGQIGRPCREPAGRLRAMGSWPGCVAHNRDYVAKQSYRRGDACG